MSTYFTVMSCFWKKEVLYGIPLVSVGFSNWKKMGEKLLKHSESGEHKQYPNHPNGYIACIMITDAY